MVIYFKFHNEAAQEDVEALPLRAPQRESRPLLGGILASGLQDLEIEGCEDLQPLLEAAKGWAAVQECNLNYHNPAKHVIYLLYIHSIA